MTTYVATYIEEEVRQEALVRNLHHFIRFVELAAHESGMLINFTKLSQEIGVAHSTIRQYYEILEDCLIAYRLDPFTKTKTRRKLLKTPKYLFFDLGVRRFAAHEGLPAHDKDYGRLFEQFVGLELLKYIHGAPEKQAQLYFWRDLNGLEVDYILTMQDIIIPIEVKWTASIRDVDLKHLRLFLKDYPETTQAFIIARVEHPLQFDKILVLPWQHIKDIWQTALTLVSVIPGKK